ncbi:hypothetical protein [Emticicia fontis]
MADVKPNPKKLKRNTVKTGETGYLDFIWIALTEDLSTFPTKTVLTPTLTYSAYATATGGFGTDAKWTKVECRKNTVKLECKPTGTLKDSSAVTTRVMFELDASDASTGFREMYKRAEVQIVLPKADGNLIWVGRKESPAGMGEFTDEESIEKSSDAFVFECSPFSYLYLPSGTTITPVVEP